MRHSPATCVPPSARPGLGRERITLLSELPRPLRPGIMVVVALIVGVAGLCQVGVLAPQFRINSEDSSFTMVLQGAPPGMVIPGVSPPTLLFPTSPPVAWVVLENVSWRGWEVTSVETERQDLEISVFLEPAGKSAPDYRARLVAAAAAPSLTRLPLMVPRGGHLVVFTTGRPGTCIAGPPFHGSQGKAQAAVGVLTPFGPRSIDASMFLDPALTSDRCRQPRL